MSTKAIRAGRRHRGTGTTPAAPFLATSLACLAGLIATYWFYVSTSTGQFIDESALVEATVARGIIGTQTSQLLDLLPVTSAVIAAIVVLFVTLARKRWKAAGIALGAMAAANLSVQLIKIWLPDRPNVGVTTLALNSLPSGHSALAASAAAAVFLVVSPRWRPAAAFMGGTYAILAGVSTLINQWHRPSDVLAAFFIVAFFTALAALGVLRTGPSWNVWLGAGQHWPSSRWWPATATLITLLTGGAMLLILRHVAGHSATSTTSFFLAGVGQIVVVGYALTVAGTLLLTDQVRRRS